MELKVVPIDPDGKPHVKNMHEAIMSIIADYSENNKVTFAEVIGTLELVKLDLWQDVMDGD